ncbi:MAG TPA: hypothetical protein VM848_08135 [Acidimicrobiia bacterium]|nr:hypothetical protein [Acidimicrobiia bacterium]
MNLERLVAGLVVSAWVRIYTLGLDASNRYDRRAELESDLWEHRNNAASEGQGSMAASLSIVGRWLAGIPADLSWRASHRGNRSQQVRERVMKNAFGTYWQGLAAFVAVATGYLGVRQFFTDEVSAGINTGKVVGLVVLVGVGLLVLAGLAVHRTSPRSGALMVMLGVLPMAGLGGFGVGLVIGLVMSLAGGLGWWWVPLGIASAVATAAGIGAFSAWWHASPKVAKTNPRTVILPLAFIGLGLLAAGAGVSLGLGGFTGPLVAFGVVLTAIGGGIWTRHLKTLR